MSREIAINSLNKDFESIKKVDKSERENYKTRKRNISSFFQRLKEFRRKESRNHATHLTSY